MTKKTLPLTVSEYTFVVPPEGMNLTEALRTIEREIVLDAVTRCPQNHQAAAKLIGLKRTTLMEKLRRISRDAELK